MALSPGARLGPYEIVSLVGAGGMGEVYKANDTRLDRTVAIKILPPALAVDPQFRERFDREARTISQLDHPHICALHDVGEQHGTAFLVMQYLEGETLADRLTKGALPFDQALQYAIQIADALDKAHRAGIVHRDLKPGNIFLTSSGAKLLDFGLAKAHAPVLAGTGASMLPTTPPITQQGMILGTIQYMAPEQIEGQEADAQTDIFTFGAILYEMATGTKAFDGKSPASVMGSILERQPPPISSVRTLTPRALDGIVGKCLAKNREDRWLTAHDLRLALELTAADVHMPEQISPSVSRKDRRRIAWTMAILAPLLALAAATVASLYVARLRTEERAVHAFVLPPENSIFERLNPSAGPVAVSPDGRRLVFSGLRADGKRLLFVYSLETGTTHALAGTENAQFPFWSPDSRFIGFFADQNLKRVDAGGGPAQVLCDVSPSARGGSWNRNGLILFAPSTNSAILSVSAAGGPVTPITTLDKSANETTHRWPWFLPDGQHFLYLAATSPGGVRIEDGATYVGSLQTHERKRLVRTLANASYASGHLLFVRDRNLIAQPFDARRLELIGEAFPIAEGLDYLGGILGAAFSVSENGMLAYQTGGASPRSRLIWLDRSGREVDAIREPLQAGSGYGGGARISPDGKRIAAVVVDPQRDWDVWLYELDRGVSTRFTTQPSVERHPVWSPDGRRLVYYSNQSGRPGLYQKDLNGANEIRILETAGEVVPTDWSADGSFLTYTSDDSTGKTKTDLWILPLFGDRRPTPFLKTAFNEGLGQFSPDARWIAYTSDVSGRSEVYIARFQYPLSTEQQEKRIVSAGGGSFPRWRRDGKELFYLSPDSNFMSVVVKSKGPLLAISSPRPLFTITGLLALGVANVYDVTADGGRFLYQREDNMGSPISIVAGWTAGLKQ